MIFTDDDHDGLRAILLIKFESKSCRWCCRECFAKDSSRRGTVPYRTMNQRDQGVGFGQDPGYQSRRLPALAPSRDPGFSWLIRTSPINRTRNDPNALMPQGQPSSYFSHHCHQALSLW